VKKLKGLIPALALAALTSAACAQSATVDHLSQKQLLERARQLEPTAAAADGAASAKLAEYPNHFTMIALRQKSGSAEVHQKYADIFLVLRGQATLRTGGSVQNPKESAPGEIRGTAVEGGTMTSIHEGDVVHIPAGVPHQILLAKHHDFVYFVIKVQEK
jgi:mannose-6-phosphate isomerase-like protein (cupin superfamily)